MLSVYILDLHDLLVVDCVNVLVNFEHIGKDKGVTLFDHELYDKLVEWRFGDIVFAQIKPDHKPIAECLCLSLLLGCLALSVEFVVCLAQ